MQTDVEIFHKGFVNVTHRILNGSTGNSEDAGGEEEGGVIEELTYGEKAFAIVLYSLISLVAVFGNGVVLYLIVRFRRLRTATNYLIANLALADLSMALMCIPFSYWPYLILNYWPFGFVPCKLINYCQAVTVQCSAYTLVAISLDRFTAVAFPLRTGVKLTKAKALFAVGVIWFSAVIIACPLLVVLRVVTDNGMDVTSETEEDAPRYCQERWTHPNQGAAYSVALMIMQYFVPLIVLVLTYAGIGAKIWYSRVPGEGNSEMNTKRQNSVRKMIPTMMIVTCVFAACWLPLNVLIILDGLYSTVGQYRHIWRVWWACHVAAMSHTLFNPIIYVLRNRKFRLGFCYVARFLPFVKYDGSLHDANKPVSVTNYFSHKRTANGDGAVAMATANFYSDKRSLVSNGSGKWGAAATGNNIYFNRRSVAKRPSAGAVARGLRPQAYMPIGNGGVAYRTSCID